MMTKSEARQYVKRADLALRVMRKAIADGDSDAMIDASNEVLGCASELQDYGNQLKDEMGR